MIELLLMPVVFCFLRISSFVAFLPPFGGAHIPSTVKIGLVFALTAFWAPKAIQLSNSEEFQGEESHTETSLSLVNSTEVQRSHWVLWTWMATRELLFGAALGWLLGPVLIPMRIAGAWLAEQLGLTMASVTSTMDSGSGNVVSTAFESSAVLLLFSLSLHHRFLIAFDTCLSNFRVGHAFQAPDPAAMIAQLTSLPAQGLSIAGPLNIVFCLIVVTLLFAMKLSPQFNLMTFGMPFRLLAGMFAMLLLFPDVLSNAALQMQSFLPFSS